jgi:hypothetical protein
LRLFLIFARKNPVKRIVLSKVVMLIILLLAFSCQDDGIRPEQIEPTPIGDFQTYAVSNKVLARAKRLVWSLNNMQASKPQTRTTDIEVNYETAKVTVNNITGAVHYSFELLEGRDDFSFDNLIVQDLGDTLIAYSMRFVPDEAWLLSENEDAPFTGNIQLIDWNGNVVSSDINGRTANTGYCFSYDAGDNTLNIDLSACAGGESISGEEIAIIVGVGGGEESGGGGGGGSQGGGGGDAPGDGDGGSGLPDFPEFPEPGYPEDPNYPPSGGGGGGDSSGGDGDSNPPADGDQPINCIIDENGNCVEVVEPVIKKKGDPEEIKKMLWQANHLKLDSTFLQDSCMMAVWREVENSTIIYDVMKEFFDSTGTGDYEIRVQLLEEVIVNGSSVNGSCTSPDEFGVMNLKISKSEARGRTQLSIARTIMHEMIHAELHRILASLRNGSEIEPECDDINVEEDTFEELWCYYLKYPKENQHEYMADHYTNTIADALAELHPVLSTERFTEFYCNEGSSFNEGGGNTNFVLNDMFKYMAWEGLGETKEFEEIITNIVENQNKYINYTNRSGYDSKCE